MNNSKLGFVFALTTSSAMACTGTSDESSAFDDRLGVVGDWCVLGDSYGPNGRPPGVCQAAGHATQDCSLVTVPARSARPPLGEGGRMCTVGSTARVLEVAGQPDYENMWGSGITLDLTHLGGNEPPTPFDATAHQGIGVSFEIDSVPEGGMRVLFPTANDPPAAGPSYWGATESFSPSPVQAGTNLVLFEDVLSPVGGQPVDATQLTQIGFLVPSDTLARKSYDFCISQVTLVRCPSDETPSACAAPGRPAARRSPDEAVQ